MIFLLILFACATGNPAPSLPGEPVDTKVLPSTMDLYVGSQTTLMSEDGLEFQKAAWSVAGVHGTAWFVSVLSTGGLQVVPSSEVKPLPSFVNVAVPTWAAINGGFYEQGPMGLVVSHGKVYHPISPSGGSGIISVGPDGIRILHRDNWVAGANEALQSIDRLVDNSASLVQTRPNAHRDARSAVALSGNRVWLVIAVADNSITSVIDGVQLNNTVGNGFTLAEFASFLIVSIGAKQALNLDGAVSTQMIVATSHEKWIAHGERGTINSIVIQSNNPK